MGNVQVKDTGSLKEKPALSHFLELAGGAFKGVLVFGRAKEKKSFIFENGNPYFPNGLLTEAVLGKKLFEKNLMSPYQHKKIKDIEASGKTFFQALTEYDVVPRDSIYDIVLEQWIEDMVTVFCWESGQFAFFEFLPKDVIKVDTQAKIHRFILHALTLKHERVKSKFKPMGYFEVAPLQGKSFVLEDFALTDLEKKIHTSFKKAKTLKSLVAELESTEQVILPILLAFKELGLIQTEIEAKAVKPVEVIPADLPNEEFSLSDGQNFFSKIKKLDELDFFQILGVERNVPPKELQVVYFTLAKKYHPDRIKTRSSIPAKDAERFFAKITEAYNTLSNPQLRKDYEYKTSKEASQHEDLMKKIVESEQVFLDGKNYLTRNMFAEAVDKLQQAVSLYDKEPEFFVKLGWALFRLGVKDNKPNKIVEGKKILTDALQNEFVLAEVPYYLGMIAKHENKPDQAMSFFRRCISIEPTHALATSELRFLEKNPKKKK